MIAIRVINSSSTAVGNPNTKKFMPIEICGYSNVGGGWYVQVGGGGGGGVYISQEGKVERWVGAWVDDEGGCVM